MAKKTFLLLVVGGFFYVAAPMLAALAMGGMLAIVLWPAFERLEKRRVPVALASGLLTCGITILFLLPLALMLFVIGKTGIQEFQTLKYTPKWMGMGWVQALIETPAVKAIVNGLTGVLPFAKRDLVEAIQDLFHSVGLRLGDFLASTMAHLPGLALALVVTIISIYFFLTDGRKVANFVRRHSVFSPSQTERLIQTVTGISISVLLASVVSGAIQAVVFMLAGLIVGASNILMVGGLVFVCSFIPLIGSAPVTLAAATHHLLTHGTAGGVFLLIVGMGVFAADNFIRPWFLKGSANLHPLLAFIAAFGGLKTIGVLGIFLGPVIGEIFVTTVDIALQTRQSENKGEAP